MSRQRDALSPIHFNLILDKKVKIEKTNVGIVLGNLNINLFVYVNDMVVVSNTIEDIEQLCGKIMTMAEKVGLVVNDGKI